MFQDYKDIVDVKQMCEMLDISNHHAYNLLKRGEIKARKVGAIYRIPKKNIIAYLEDVA